MLKSAATEQTNINGVSEEVSSRSIKPKAAAPANAIESQSQSTSILYEKLTHNIEEEANCRRSSESSSSDSSIVYNGITDKAATDGSSNSTPKSTSVLESIDEVVSAGVTASSLSSVMIVSPSTTTVAKNVEPMKNSTLYVLNGNVLKEVNDVDKVKTDKVNYVCVTANNLGSVIKKIQGENAAKNGISLTGSGGELDSEKSKFISSAPTILQLSHPSLKGSCPKIAFTVSPTIVTKPSTNTCEILRSKLLENPTAGQSVSKEMAAARAKADRGASIGLSTVKQDQVQDSPAVAKARSELVRCRKALIEAAIHPQLPIYSPPAFYTGPTYSCEECEDSFSSPEGLSNHKNRRSVLFSYACPVCKKTLEFYSRCMFLLHVRSHDVAVKACFLTISIIPANKLNFPVLSDELWRNEVETVSLLDTGYDISSADRSSPTADKSATSESSQTSQFVRRLKKRKASPPLDESADERQMPVEDKPAAVERLETAELSSDDGVAANAGISSSHIDGTTDEPAGAVTIRAKKMRKKRSLSSVPTTPSLKPAPASRLTTYTTTNCTSTTPTPSLSRQVECSASKSGRNTPVFSTGCSPPANSAARNSASPLDEIHLTSSDEDEATPPDTDNDKLVTCRECGETVPSMTSHYRASNLPLKEFPCEQCKFFNPSACALVAHTRMHSRSVPYICPDCGFYFNSIDSFLVHVKQVCFYDYKTIRFKCPECSLLKPSVPLFIEHLKRCHIREVFKCSVCITSSYSARIVQAHMERFHPESTSNVLEGYRCMLCPNVLVAKQSINVHVKKHVFGLHHLRYVYICKFCKKFASGRMSKFEAHYYDCADRPRTPSPSPSRMARRTSTGPPCGRRSPEKDPLSMEDGEADRLKAEYVPKTKWCVMCRTTKLNEHSKSLFCNACVSYVNADGSGSGAADDAQSERLKKTEAVAGGRSKRKLKCKLCKQLLNRDWSTITNHYLLDHHADFDVGSTAKSREGAAVKSREGVVTAGSSTAPRKRKSSALKQEPAVPTTSSCSSTTTSCSSTTTSCSSTTTSSTAIGASTTVANVAPAKMSKVECKYRCVKCGFSTNVRNDFHEHIVSHKTQSNTNYQCLECGECFIVKPSLEKHLIVVHKVRDFSEYDRDNRISGSDNDSDDQSKEKAVAENQCEVCYMQCDSKQQYDRHIRTHGMAFVAMQSRAKS